MPRAERAAMGLLLVCLALFAAGRVPGAQEDPTTHAPKPTGVGLETSTVGYAEISGVIDRTASRYLARVVDQARNDNIGKLIVRIDTDGGEVLYAREMLKLLLDQAGQGPRMLALVDYRAISAGALIAYGHEAVYITDTASIGDIGVIFVAPGGRMEYAPEKVETVVRALLVQASETRGWNKGLLLKMTARNQALYKITLEDGHVEYVIEDDLPEYLSRHPDIDREDASQMIVYRGKDRLLTLTGREATELGMATGLVDGIDALYRQLQIDPTKVIDLRPSMAEQIAARLSPWAPVLAGLAMLFVFLELKTPGVGLWLALGGVCAVLFLISQYYLDMANNVEVVLVLVGAALLAIEVFTMIGGGILSVVGGSLVLGGLILTFLPNEFEFDPSDERFLDALGNASVSGLMALGVMTLGIVAFILIVPRSRLSRRLAVGSEISATSSGALEASGNKLVGRRGVSRDPLHPGGMVIIDGEEYTALAEHGAFIDSGESLLVVSVRLGELVVRADGDGGDVGSEGT